MAHRPLGGLADYVYRLVARPAVEAASDRDLLERFVKQHDEAAFATLLARHGPMVSGVCRRLLGDEHAAEDAFQATFIVLFHRAAAMPWQETIGSWLHQVAYRTARKAKIMSQRRQAREQEAGQMRSSSYRDQHGGQDVLTLIDEELHNLPARFRIPVVLCCVEGLSKTEAARQLGWNEGTLASRLARGRAALQQRLTARGAVLPAAGLAAVLSGDALTAAVAPALAQVTQQAVQATATGAGSVSAAVTALVQGVLAEMSHMKLKLAVLGGLFLAVLGSGVAALAQRGEAEPEQPVAVAKERAPAAANQAVAAEQPVARMGTLSWRTGGHHISFLALQDDQVISAGRDGWVRVWDRATGKELRRFGDVADQTPYAGPFVVMSPDGKRLVVAAHESLQSTRMIFDVATGKEVCRLPEGLTPRAFSPDGRLLLAAGSKNALNMLDAATGKELHCLDLNAMTYMTMPIFTPDGRSLAAIVGGKHLQFWDAASGKPTRKLLIGNTSNTVGPPLFSADGRAVLCMNGIIDLTNDKETAVPGQTRSDTAYAIYSPDLKTAAVVNRDGPIHLHELTTGKRLHTLGGPLPHKGGYQNVAFSPTGKFLVSSDGGTGRATVWNVQTGAQALPEESTHDVRLVSFGRNDDTMAGAGYGSMIRLWDSRTGKPLAVANSTGHDGAIMSLDVSADGKTLSTLGDRTVRQWDLASGKETACHHLGASAQAKSVHTVAGRTVVCGIGPAPFGNAGPILTLLDVATGKNLIELDVAGGPNVSLSPDGKYVILQLRNLYRVYEAATGKEIFKLEDPVEAALGGIPVQPGGAMAFAPDGNTVATLVILSTNQRLSGERPFGRPERPVARIEGTFVNLWSLRTGKKLRELKVPGVGIAEAVFTPDGRSLVLAAGQFAVAVNEDRNPAAMPTDAPLYLWEVAGGGLRRPLAMKQRPELFAVSPDSRLLAAVTARDPAIRLFSLITGAEVGQRSGHLGPVRCLAFTPDSRRLISGSEDTTALVHDVAGLGTMVRTDLSRGDVERLWGDLADRSSSKASNALAALLGNGARTVSYLKEHVKPVAQPDAKEMARLLAALDAEQFDEREQAAAKLEALGELALDPLHKRLAGKPSLEVSRRIERILTAIETQPAPAATLRTLRAIEVLELLGTPDAQLVLDKLAQGAAGARITVEAQAARQRLARRQR